MKNKLTLLLSFTLLLTGCNAKSSIDYVGENSSSSNETTSMNEMENSQIKGFSDFSWKEDINLKGSDKIIHIDLTTKEDSNNKSYGYLKAAEIKDFSPSQKENILKNLFLSSEIYYFDDENLPKFFLQNMADYYREGFEKQKYENYDKIADDSEARIPDAPDDFTIADDFSANEYIGYIDDIPYYIDFNSDNYRYDYERNILTEINYISLQYNQFGLKNGKLEARELSVEETEKLADEMISKLNIDGLTRINTSKADFYDYTQYKNSTEYSCTYKQYYSTFPGAEGPLIQKEWTDDEGNTKTVYSNKSIPFFQVNICDGYVRDIYISYPIEIIEAVDKTSLLPLENIIDIIRKELETNGLDYVENAGIYDTIKINKLELNYLYCPVPGSDKIDVIPCWKLGGDNPLKAMVINAIDGTILKNIWYSGWYYNIFGKIPYYEEK